MRRRIVAGNWKMNTDHREGARLAKAILGGLEGRDPACEVVLFPSYTTLPAVVEVLAGSTVGTGAQDLYFEERGAYTGEISAGMLSALGVSFALAGHSERRHVFGEGDQTVARKLRAALGAGLVPVLCVGELLEEREAGNASRVVETQVRASLEGLSTDEFSRVVVAYEPVWAIGTGKTATPEDAAEIHTVLRRILGTLFDTEAASMTPILYGGSVQPSNARELLDAENVDGVLVGGASLEADSFLSIIFPV
jgi:triosephosphate isomerase